MREAKLQVVSSPGIIKVGYDTHPSYYSPPQTIAWDFHLLMTWNHYSGYITFRIIIKPQVSVTQPHYVPPPPRRRQRTYSGVQYESFSCVRQIIKGKKAALLGRVLV